MKYIILIAILFFIIGCDSLKTVPSAKEFVRLNVACVDAGGFANGYLHYDIKNNNTKIRMHTNCDKKKKEQTK